MKTCKNWCFAAGGCLFAVGLIVNVGRAQYDSTDTRLPSPMYRSANQVVYASGHRIDSFFDVFADFQRVPEPTGVPFEIHSFFDVFTELSLAAPGGAPNTYQNYGDAQMRLNGLPPGTPYPRVYDTEMLQLNLTGSGLPAGVRIRESPTLASTGKTTITPIGGGVYHIDSFFDVFTELSIDGGQSWIPSSNPMRLNGDLPEPSSALLSLLGSVAMMGLGRRRGRS